MPIAPCAAAFGLIGGEVHGQLSEPKWIAGLQVHQKHCTAYQVVRYCHDGEVHRYLSEPK
jgi:hypothetical protein